MLLCCRRQRLRNRQASFASNDGPLAESDAVEPLCVGDCQLLAVLFVRVVAVLLCLTIGVSQHLYKQHSKQVTVAMCKESWKHVAQLKDSARHLQITQGLVASAHFSLLGKLQFVHTISKLH